MPLRQTRLSTVSHHGLSETDVYVPGALRLLQAERSDEIYPILLEEIVTLGHQRALVMMADFETGAIAPVAAIACPEEFIDGFRTSLYAADHPLTAIFHSLQPAIIPKAPGVPRQIYCHPLIYRNANVCWE